MRISILFSSLSSYMVAFFRELALKEGCDLQLIYKRPNRDAPYKEFDLSFCGEAFCASGEDWATLTSRVSAFEPDCILMCSWNFSHYMAVSREFRKRGTLVVATMDNQWHGTIKQILGVLTSRWFLKPAIDNFLVAGDRQAEFARRLGYGNVMYGCYAAEVDRFGDVASEWTSKPAFLFVGRLVKEKGVDILAEGYTRYRKQASRPWRLTVIGTGPLVNVLRNIDGVDVEGFVQPENLPDRMRRSGCLVLPSRFEPWGVVVHEAAAAGLPIICTFACGASTYFVRDGVNGYIVPDDSFALADALHQISSSPLDRLKNMSGLSRTLGGLWTPAMLAEYFAKSVGHTLALRRQSETLKLATRKS